MQTKKEVLVPDLASLSDDEVCAEIGRRLRAERLRRGLSQSAMSELSGIPLRTYKRFETTGTGAITTLVAALRTFGRLVGLQLLLPQPELPERRSPLDDITKRRVIRKKSKSADDA